MIQTFHSYEGDNLINFIVEYYSKKCFPVNSQGKNI